MPTAKPVIAIVPGDCTGIGPEQTARIFAEGRARDVARLLYVGDIRVLKLGMRQAKVDVAARERGEIQAKILKLNKEREQYLAGERKKQAGAKEDTLDKAIVKAIRDQATRHNFKFE